MLLLYIQCSGGLLVRTLGRDLGILEAVGSISGEGGCMKDLDFKPTWLVDDIHAAGNLPVPPRLVFMCARPFIVVRWLIVVTCCV